MNEANRFIFRYNIIKTLIPMNIRWAKKMDQWMNFRRLVEPSPICLINSNHSHCHWECWSATVSLYMVWHPLFNGHTGAITSFGNLRHWWVYFVWVTPQEFRRISWYLMSCRSMLSLGRSKPWPEAMFAITGQRDFDASAMIDYFRNLQTWLQMENADAAKKDSKDLPGWNWFLVIS